MGWRASGILGRSVGAAVVAVVSGVLLAGSASAGGAPEAKDLLIYKSNVSLGTADGFAGKGAIDNGGSVTISVTAVYQITCEWDTVTGGQSGKDSKTIHHEVKRQKTASISPAVTLDARTNKNAKVTGYFWSSTWTAIGESEIGDACQPVKQGAVVTSVSAEGSSSTVTLTNKFGSVTKDLF